MFHAVVRWLAAAVFAIAIVASLPSHYRPAIIIAAAMTALVVRRGRVRNASAARRGSEPAAAPVIPLPIRHTSDDRRVLSRPRPVHVELTAGDDGDSDRRRPRRIHRSVEDQ